MTEAEMVAVERRLGQLRAAKDVLEKARHKLRLVNGHVKANPVWEPSLILEARPYERDVTVTVRVTGGMLQQSAIDEVRRAERHLIGLGGTP